MGMNKDFWGRRHCVYLYTLIFKGRFARSLLKGLLYVTLKEGLNMTGFFHQKVFVLRQKKNSDLKPAELVGDDFRFSFKVIGDGFLITIFARFFSGCFADVGSVP